MHENAKKSSTVEKVPDDFDALLKLPGVGRKKCESDHGGCVRKIGDRHRHTLYPSGEPHGTGKKISRNRKSRDGTVEDHSTGRGE